MAAAFAPRFGIALLLVLAFSTLGRSLPAAPSYDGVVETRFYNGENRSLPVSVTFPDACPNPLVFVQSYVDRTLTEIDLARCPHGPASCRFKTVRVAEPLHAYASNITEHGFTAYAETQNRVVNGAVSPKYPLAYHVDCDAAPATAGRVNVRFYNGSAVSTVAKIAIPASCTDRPVVLAQPETASVLCGSGAGPAVCAGNPGSTSQSLVGHVDVPGDGTARIFLSAKNGVWVGSGRNFSVAYHLECGSSPGVQSGVTEVDWKTGDVRSAGAVLPWSPLCVAPSVLTMPYRGSMGCLGRSGTAGACWDNPASTSESVSSYVRTSNSRLGVYLSAAAPVVGRKDPLPVAYRIRCQAPPKHREPLSPEALKAIVDPIAERRLSATGERDRAAGILVGISRQGQRHFFAYGTTRRGEISPPTAEDLWSIGSNTKVFTALLLALAANGSGNPESFLQRTVGESLPLSESAWALEPEKRALTLAMLATHTSGLPYRLDPTVFPTRSDDLRRFLDLLAPAALPFVPGTHFAYSNPGFALLGAALEAISGERFEAAVARAITGPLQLESTGRWPAGHHVQGYAYDRTRNIAMPLPASEVGSVDFPTGGLRASGADYLAWIDAVRENGGPREIGKAMQLLKQLRFRFPCADQTGDRCAMGLGVQWREGVYWKDGQTDDGFHTIGLFDEDTSVVVLTNQSDVDVVYFGNEILARVR